MNFVVENSGKTNVIFLHGWGADYSSFYFIKDYVLNSTLHFANLDGFGGEPSPQDPSILGYAQRLNKYITNNNLKNVVLVGHSFGGRVAIEYASKHSVLGLVLVDSAGIKPRYSLKRHFKVVKYKLLKQLAKINIIKKEKLLKFGSLDYKNADDKLKKVLVSCTNYNQRPIVKYIVAPTLIVWGQNDKDTPLYMAKILDKQIKKSKLIVIEKCGHFSFLERPHMFCNLLQDFINSLQKGEWYD